LLNGGVDMLDLHGESAQGLAVSRNFLTNFRPAPHKSLNVVISPDRSYRRVVKHGQVHQIVPLIGARM